MKLYRFSPIAGEEECIAALEYIEEQLRVLSNKVFSEQLPINTLKIFAHYDDEYKFLHEWVHSIGKQDAESSSRSLYVKPNEAMTINDSPIEYVGIRVVDPYRSQVGCGDYVIENFDEFKQKYLGKSPNIRQVDHVKYEMLELFDPDIDVLGYIVKDY